MACVLTTERFVLRHSDQIMSKLTIPEGDDMCRLLIRFGKIWFSGLGEVILGSEQTDRQAGRQTDRQTGYIHLSDATDGYSKALTLC